MALRISLPWWPVLALTSPVTVPLVLLRNITFKKNRARADDANRKRLESAEPLELPGLDFLKVTVLVEWEAEEGFLGAPGVSYLLQSDRGSLLFDVGFGPERGVLAHNAARLGFGLDRVDALAISHLHLDHMGGMKAQRSGQVRVPEELGSPGGRPCFLPGKAGAEGFEAEVIEGPRLLAAGIASIGPLARSLFFLGYTEEQALLARIRGKGLVVFTGCGHPTIEVILQMVRRLSNEPIHAVVGGLHFPITSGRGHYAGIQMQMILGTGMPPWRPITDEDLGQAIASINQAGPNHVLLSAHDTCDHAIARFMRELHANTEVLKAGGKIRL